jgi:murein DD-endopeptidase MepM/ murein hydrolase activator NlpD
MRPVRAAVLSLALAVLPLAACQPSRGTAPELPPPPPDDGSAVAAYAALRDRTIREGREIDVLLTARDEAALLTRFGAALSKAMPPDVLHNVLSAIFTQGALGPRVDDGAVVLAVSNRTYIADHRWGNRLLSVTLGFDATGAVTALWLRPRDALPSDPRAGYKTQVPLRLPVRGTWWVFWGGRLERENYHLVALDQRHAIDLAVWRGGATHGGDAIRNEDYHAWGQPVVAPADGTVVVAVDGVRDNRPRVESTNLQAPFGNHLLLDIGRDECLLLAHLREGSLRVRPGQAVKAGDLLAQVGNSGSSSEPHLHVHLQDRKEVLQRAVGLPVQFAKVLVDGVPVEKASLRQGQFVRSPE